MTFIPASYSVLKAVDIIKTLNIHYTIVFFNAIHVVTLSLLSMIIFDDFKEVFVVVSSILVDEQ